MYLNRLMRLAPALFALMLLTVLLSACGEAAPIVAPAPPVESVPVVTPEPPAESASVATPAPTAAEEAPPECAAASAVGDEDPAAEEQHESVPREDLMTKSTHKTTHVDWDYWIYEPDIPVPEEGLPLVIYMHGDGGRGVNPDRLVLNDSGLGRFLYEGTVRVDALVLIAQSASGWRSMYSDFAELIDWAVEAYHADPDRVSVVGVSAGGVGCFQMVLRYPDRFCCAAVLGGAVSPRQASEIRLPLRVYHGELDYAMGFSVVSACKQINESGGQAELFMMEGVRHSEQIALSDSEWGLWDWVLAQKRTED